MKNELLFTHPPNRLPMLAPLFGLGAGNLKVVSLFMIMFRIRGKFLFTLLHLRCYSPQISSFILIPLYF